MLPLFVLLVFGSLAVVVYTILTDVEEKSVVRSSLRQLDGYEVENVRDQELLVPLRQRALIPLVTGLTGLGPSFTPVGYVDGVRQKFVYSGRPSAEAVDRFLAVRVLTVTPPRSRINIAACRMLSGLWIEHRTILSASCRFGVTTVASGNSLSINAVRAVSSIRSYPMSNARPDLQRHLLIFFLQ